MAARPFRGTLLALVFCVAAISSAHADEPAEGARSTADQEADASRNERATPSDSLYVTAPDSLHVPADRSIFRHLRKRGLLPPLDGDSTVVVVSPGTTPDGLDLGPNVDSGTNRASAIMDSVLAARKGNEGQGTLSPSDSDDTGRGKKPRQAKPGAATPGQAEPAVTNPAEAKPGAEARDPDSLEAIATVADSSGADSTAVTVAAADTTAMIEPRLPGVLPHIVQRHGIWTRSPDRVAREMWPWESSLRTIESGSPFTPDPIGRGDLPGREPLSLVAEGLPAGPPSMPEASPEIWAPSWAGEQRLWFATPLRLPNNPTGGPILEMEWLRPDTTTTVSGARLSDGNYDSNSNEFYFIRPSGDSLYQLFWSDQKSQGRLNYGAPDGSNLVLRYSRSGALNWSVAAHHQFARQRVFDELLVTNRRWLWERDAYVASLDGEFRGWSVDLGASTGWYRHGWEGEVTATRKSRVSQVLLRTESPGHPTIPARFLASAQLDRERLRFYQIPAFALQLPAVSHDETHTGMGFAVGLGGETDGRRYEASVGRSQIPGWDGEWTFAAEVDQSWRSWMLRTYVGRTARVPLLVRLPNDLYTQVGQGLTVPGTDGSELETVDTIEAWLDRGEPTGGRLRLGLRRVEVHSSVSATSGTELADLVSLAYLTESVSSDALGQDVSAVSAHLEWERGLPWGLSTQVAGVVRSVDDDARDQLWFTPAEARVRLSWEATLFAGAMDLKLFVRGRWNDDRTTILGRIAPMNRFDAGGTATISTMTLFYLLENLENDVRESATVDQTAMSLPLRSYRMGLTWRFFD